MKETKIVKLRSSGKGIAGTYANIAHHAKEVEVFVRALEPLAPHWGFKIWKQGHNIHQFETHTGAKYTLRPVYHKGEGDERGYHGLALSLRLTRSAEHVLTQCTRITDIPRLAEMMRMLAKPQQGSVSGGFNIIVK